jgi:hypothetical protein
MFFRLFTKAAFACAIVFASVYAPLQAQQDSTVQVPTKSDRPFWIFQITGKYQSIGGESNLSLNTRLAQDLPNAGSNVSVFTGGNRLLISPFNLMWNHNRWIVYAGYNLASYNNIAPGFSSTNYTAASSSNELIYGVGYALINTPRFRLYPMLGNYGTFDNITISQVSSLSTLLKTFDDRSISLQRNGGLLEFAVGADYSFPLEYGDVYIMAKVGYNWEAGAFWSSNGKILTDTDPNWLSRRGVFFQIGVGFGTERH